MTFSDVAERVREGLCILGCNQRGVHFASCDDYGKEPADATCRGCAPSPSASDATLCSRHLGRMRSLLRDAPDLIGRLRSLSDPTKAMTIEPVKTFSRAVEAAAPVGPDLLDAADEMLDNLRGWAHYVKRDIEQVLAWHSRFAGITALSAFSLAHDYTSVILKNLDRVVADPQRTLRLAEAVLVRHPEIEGEREAWSIADAMDRWGVERRDRHVHPDVDADPDREESATPVREWYDPLLTIKVAAERVGVSHRTIQRWVASEALSVVAKVRDARGSVLSYVRASQVDQVAETMDAQRNAGRAISVLERVAP